MKLFFALCVGFSVGLVCRLGAQELTVHRAVEIEFSGQRGVYYQHEASSDLESWQAVGEPFRGQGRPVARSLRVRGDQQYFRSVETDPVPTKFEETVFQHATLGALLVGAYEGDLSFGELLLRGDFGLGTFQGVDGELIILDGQAYRVRVDGMVYQVPNETLTPFAVITFFEPDLVFELADISDYGALQAEVAARLGSENLPYAIKVVGRFESLTTRSVAAQERPFPPLSEVVAEQATFDLVKTEGTMVGFRMPNYAAEINAAGFHFHFVDSLRTTGGHVLALSGASVRVEVDVCRGIDVDLPMTSDFLDAEIE